MRLRPTPPAIPPELLAQYGEAEEAFGPNMRFRRASLVLGAFLLLLGVGFFVFGVAALVQRAKGSYEAVLFSGLCLMTMGGVAIGFALSGARNWVFVCPRGLVRTFGRDWIKWEGVGWADVLRVEDVNSSHGLATMRRCRIVAADGAQWDFLADLVAHYGRLVAVLRRKVEERRMPPEPDG